MEIYLNVNRMTIFILDSTKVVDWGIKDGHHYPKIQ